MALFRAAFTSGLRRLTATQSSRLYSNTKDKDGKRESRLGLSFTLSHTLMN